MDKFKKPTAEHYHIFLDTDMSDDTIRLNARNHLKIPKGQRGKASQWYTLHKHDQDIDYFCKHGQIKFSEGFAIENLKDAIERGSQKYLKDAIVETPKEEAQKPVRAQQNEWELLLSASNDLPNEKIKDFTARDWASFINMYYIKRLRPFPRTGDLLRYAKSLHVIHKSKGLHNVELVTAMVYEYTNFQCSPSSASDPKII